MLRVANKRQVELRDSLRMKLSAATQQQKKLRGDLIETLDEMAFYGSQLKRSLMGGMPKFEGMDEDDEANKKSGSSRSKSSSLSVTERALSSSSRARRYELIICWIVRMTIRGKYNHAFRFLSVC